MSVNIGQLRDAARVLEQFTEDLKVRRSAVTMRWIERAKAYRKERDRLRKEVELLRQKVATAEAIFAKFPPTP